MTPVRPVAIVEEQLDDNCARVRWMFNPVPDGQALLWDHGGTPVQAETPSDETRWAEWVAGMVGSYLGWPVDDKRNSAVAGIIQRRLWGLRGYTTQQAEAPTWMLPGHIAQRIGMTHRVSAAVVQDIAKAMAEAPTACPHGTPHRWPCDQCDAPTVSKAERGAFETAKARWVVAPGHVTAVEAYEEGWMDRAALATQQEAQPTGPLSSRLRPNVECAPWVIAEVVKLEQEAQPQADEATAVDFYRRNPSAALLDFSRRVAAQAEPAGGGKEDALRYAEQSMAAMRDALMPSFEYVGVSLRVSQEDHAAIRSALAGLSTALHIVRAARAAQQATGERT